MKKVRINEIAVLFPWLEKSLPTILSSSEGKYFLPNGAYYNVAVYDTTNRDGRQYESHKNYVDIQIVKNGKEIITVQNINRLSVSQKYDSANDVIFYLNDNKGIDILLEQGEALMLLPKDGHMPSINSLKNQSEEVKKIVIKIPYRHHGIVKFLVTDVDGTLTDGKIYISPSGEAMKAFNIKDGCGIHDILIPNNITPVIITGRESQIVLNRAKEIGIANVYQGKADKLATLKEITSELGSVAYIGDDINDLICMNAVKEAGGVVGCPADAYEKVIEIADFVAEHNGGDGAVRDFIEWILASKF